MESGRENVPTDTRMEIVKTIRPSLVLFHSIFLTPLNKTSNGRTSCR